MLFLTTGSRAVAQNAGNDLTFGNSEIRSDGEKSITLARATWDTGWFQTEVFRHLLQDLGYTVAEPKTQDNQDFYRLAAEGEFDLWANGWFPLHNTFIHKNQVQDKLQAVGYEVKAGALQGYMIDKKTADALKIENLDDLRNPKIARLFDVDGNGKADLIGCNKGWGCEPLIEHHLDVYNLRDTVEHVQGEYSPLMADTVARCKHGQPVLFYTWTPNWTVGTLVPGKDVVWIEVPFPSLPERDKDHENQTTIEGVPGCVNNPCTMGFPPNDIRVVANKQFIVNNPDIKRLLELVEIPLGDISAQNAKMLDEVERGAADVAIAGISITVKREQVLDFSHAFFETGLQIMVREGSGSVLGKVVSKVFAVIFSRELFYGVAFFFIILLIASHIIWALERRHNPQFPERYPQGIWQSIWWAMVTVTTVGYGDKTPKGTIGRLFGVVWILAGYFVFAYFTASVTTTATVQELHGIIDGPQDLFGKQVVTVEKSTAAEYLAGQGITALTVDDVNKAYPLLESGEVDAIVYDAPVLQHYASKTGRGKVKVVGLLFEEQNYGIAIQGDSPYRERINIALLKLIESGVYQQIVDKWFGA